MPKALKVCSCLGCGGCGDRCPEIVQTGRCDRCRRAADQRRGTAAQRGYGTKHRQRFRPAVLAKDPQCVVCQAAPSTVADHWPRSRRELVAEGLDPDDPQHGRGLCGPCHNRSTGQLQPGGWNVR